MIVTQITARGVVPRLPLRRFNSRELYAPDPGVPTHPINRGFRHANVHQARQPHRCRRPRREPARRLRRRSGPSPSRPLPRRRRRFEGHPARRHRDERAHRAVRRPGLGRAELRPTTTSRPSTCPNCSAPASSPTRRVDRERRRRRTSLTSHAETADVDLLGGLITADAVDTTSTTTFTGTDFETNSYTQFVNLKISNFDVPINIARNFTLTIPGVAKVVLN